MTEQQHALFQPASSPIAGRYRRIFVAGLAGIALAASVTACSSGGGGDSGGQGGDGGDPGDVIGGGADASVAFSYPLNGQTDVYTQTQIAVAFRGDVADDAGLTLVVDGTPVDTDVERDSNQPSIFRLSAADDSGNVERAALAPNTSYSVQDGDGDTLFSFATRSLDGRPGEGAFSVSQLTRIGDRNVPFTAFNPIRARFTSPVDEGSVELCDAGETLGTDCTVSVTGPDGAVPGRLTVLGSNLTFDPSSDLGDGTPNSRNAADYDSSDLVGGQTYTVAFDGVQSAFGDTLDTSFDVTPVAISQGDSVDTVQPLTIAGGSGDSPLNGSARNVANIVSQLIGRNDQSARNNPNRGGLLTRLAGTTGGSRYNNTFPALLPAGQVFDLEAIELKLNGEVETPVKTGPIHATFVNDADVYLAGSAPLGAIEQPTKVLLRLDLGISTDVPQGDPIKALSNGVFNQTAMNVVAAGLAVPQANGDIKLTTLGSFPASVNRTGNAITDFELELTLPNPNGGSEPATIAADQTAPRIIAQYPSACFYTFNTEGFESGGAISGEPGSTTLSDTEADCIEVMSQRNIRATGDDAFYDFPEPRANSLPLRASPSITFSEPVDPISLGANITLTNNADSTEVPARLRSEGASVVIDPVEALDPDTQYTVTVGNGVTDLAGNGLAGSFPGSTTVSGITFNTGPMVVPTGSDGTPSDIDPTGREAVRQTAPFLTVLTPGLACSLDPESGDFRSSGGDIAGHCIGDTSFAEPTIVDPPSASTSDEPVAIPASPATVYPVFAQPANNTVNAYFSKPVKADTIQLADGCLIGGDGNTNTQATVAVQIMNGGECAGVVDGKLALLTPDQNLTEGFSFRPAEPFELGQRYWIVICGSANPRDPEFSYTSQCTSGSTIMGQNGLPLNTTPLRATGSQVIDKQTSSSPCPYGAAESIGGSPVNCFSDYRGGGGPDIVMPFEGAPATQDFYATMLALPETDTNGNGLFDNTPYESDLAPGDPDVIGGINSGEDRRSNYLQFNDAFGRERAQPANSVKSVTLAGLIPDAPAEKGFLSGGLPVAVRDLAQGQSCAPTTEVRFDDGTSVIGTGAPSSCMPVDLLPGGLVAITGLPAGRNSPTGRLPLRFPYGLDESGNATGPQTGYIVPRCQGTFQGQPYDYAPCFVANLRLTVNAPDTFGPEGGGDGLKIQQQDLRLHVFGPVAFEQNGRMVISTRNANSFSIITQKLLLGGVIKLTMPAPTAAGDQSLQLVGPAIHGGRAFPVR